MSDVKWIKIVTDIFNDEKILLIESMPSSDENLVIWFKLLCLAGKINNGGVLMLDEKLAYTDGMLATICRREKEVVSSALKVFEDLGMIRTINKTITIPNWPKHQSLDRLRARNEYMRDYMKKYRQEQADLSYGRSEDNSDQPSQIKSPPGGAKKVNKELKENVNSKVNGKANSKVNSKTNGKVNVSSLEEEGELYKEEVDKDIYKNIVAYLNQRTGKNYKYTTKGTKSHINARLKEGFKLEDFKIVIDNKTRAWKGKKDMEAYLRPSTLFGNKFESYLNERAGAQGGQEYGW